MWHHEMIYEQYFSSTLWTWEENFNVTVSKPIFYSIPSFQDETHLDLKSQSISQENRPTKVGFIGLGSVKLGECSSNKILLYQTFLKGIYRSFYSDLHDCYLALCIKLCHIMILIRFGLLHLFLSCTCIHVTVLVIYY